VTGTARPGTDTASLVAVGTVEAEIEMEPSVRGVADLVEQKMGSGENLYLHCQGQPLNW
jgi:hypothetical protein